VIVVLELLAAFVLIVGGAVGFTNAVEWLGHRLNLGAGAVGAILAAVGTALPESTIPIVALVRHPGDPEAIEIAIGSIIGAPFLLGTVAMLIVAGSAIAFRTRREQDNRVEIDPRSTRRDLHFFLAVMPIALIVGALAADKPVRIGVAVLLVLAYFGYTARTIKQGGDATDDELQPLFFARTKDDPPSTLPIVVQLLVSLAAIILGAELFVGGVQSIAESLSVEPLIIALILAPLATELPEKANSIVWMRQGKDVLAVGNITGAMAFQSTIPVALGLMLTEWDLNRYAIAAGVAGIAGAALALCAPAPAAPPGSRGDLGRTVRRLRRVRGARLTSVSPLQARRNRRTGWWPLTPILSRSRHAPPHHSHAHRRPGGEHPCRLPGARRADPPAGVSHPRAVEGVHDRRRSFGRHA
jgi:cation:H+ antiporter